jgi:RNA polymerase sigma factor (sigma-70 family)
MDSFSILSMRGSRVDTATFDESYITGLRDQDPETVAHLMAHFRTPIRAKAYKKLWMRDLEEDVYQETMRRIFERFSSGEPLDDPACLPGFVLATCTNVIHETNRKNRESQIPEDWDPPDPSGNVHDYLVTPERMRLVWKVLPKLRKRDRELLMAILGGANTAELCRRFDVTEKHLRTLRHRARKRFQKELWKMEGGPHSERPKALKRLSLSNHP